MILLYVIFSILLSGECLGNQITRNDYDLTQVTPIELAAVGRVAPMGALYDVRSDKFLHLSIFKSQIPLTSIQSTHNRQTKLQYTFTNTLEEKFETLDISAGLKLSIMGGLFELEGSGQFFKDTKKSAKSAKASVVNSILTEYEQISITDTLFIPLINMDALEQIDATHVVVGIQWGGSVFVSVEDTNSQNEDQQKVHGALRAQLTKAAAKISGEAQVDFNEQEKAELSKFNFELYGDILPDEVPQNLIDALKFMRIVSRSLQSGNGGKGKAIKYNLIPISLLRKMLKLQTNINSVIKKVDDSTVRKCVKLFDSLNKHEQIINDLVDYVLPYENYIESDKVKEIKNIQFNQQIYQSEVKMNFSDQLVLVRSGIESTNKIGQLMTKATEHKFSWRNIESGLNNLQNQVTKEVTFIKLMLDRNVTFLSKKQTLNLFYNLNYNNDVYILFYNDEEDFGQTMATFRNIIENRVNYGPKAVFAAVKNKLYNLPEETKVSLVRNGRVVIENFKPDSKVPDPNKPELWSLYTIQTQLANLLDYTEKQKIKTVKDQAEIIGKINSINNEIIPIGFIYVQIFGQDDPNTLWPKTVWENVSAKYAGLFFRAEGGDAAPFGQTQDQQSWGLELKVEKFEGDDWWTHVGPHTVANYFDYKMYTGSDKGNDWGMFFRHVINDNRPKNSAIKIWRRIK